MVASAARYVRRAVKGDGYQCRPPVGPLRWNLGLYHADDYPDDRGRPDRGNAIAAAERAGREFTRRLFERERAAPACLEPGLVQLAVWAWAVTRELQATTRFGRPVVPPGVLPPWVKRVAGGYEATARLRGAAGTTVVTLSGPVAGRGPFQSPVTAFVAMATYLGMRSATGRPVASR